MIILGYWANIDYFLVTAICAHPFTASHEEFFVLGNDRYIFIASMNVKAEYVQLFNEVYDEEHIPYLLKVPGVSKVTRCEGQPFEFSIGGNTKQVEAPLQRFVAIYEINHPAVVNSSEWAFAVEKGRWSTQVRQHTSDRSHFMYTVL